MSDFYVPQQNAVNPIKPAAQSASQITSDAAGTIQTNQNLGAAKAFQDHLNKGYQGMVETLKEVPPQIASTIPDPGAFSDSEDKRVAWYAMLNDAVAKNGLLDQAQAPNSSPDALATSAARAPLSAESRGLVGGEINRLEQNQQKDAIRKALGDPQPIPAVPKDVTPSIDPKTPFGRTLKIAMTRMEPHADTIQNAADAAKIPAQLVMAVAAQESGGTAGATSKTGVRGTMQVTEGTFKDISSRYPDLKLTDRTDPQQSYTAGAMYLGELMQKFGGNVDQALAAYNAGPSAVRMAVAKYPGEWRDHLEEFISAPKGMTAAEKAQETSDYVNKVGKYFAALGGKAPTPTAKTPTQNEFNMALFNANPDAVVNPIAKEIKSGLKTDAYVEANAKKADAASAVQDRLMAKFKLEQDSKTYQKVNNYNKQVADLTAPVQSIARIGQLLGGFDAKGDVPGVGLGANMFKKFLMTSATPEAQQMRLAIQNMFTDIGFSEAGKNFTNKEMELVNSKLGVGDFQDADTFRKAMKIQAEKFKQRLNNPWNALPDDVRKEMIDAGVTNPDMLDVEPGPGSPSPVRVASAGGKKPSLSTATQAILDKVRAERAAKAGN
jgi:soluble lytic murein transglycosylase-like protein